MATSDKNVFFIKTLSSEIIFSFLFTNKFCLENPLITSIPLMLSIY